MKESNFSVEYFVIGASAKIENNTHNKNKVPKGSSLFFWADYFKGGGFAAVRVAVDNMTVEMMDSFETSLYRTQLYPRQSVTVP